MLAKIFNFELRYRIGRPATWGYFGILFLFGFLNAIYGSTPGSEKAFANSPVALGRMIITISIFGTFLASAVMGMPLYRDIEHKVKDYFFTYPIDEKQYVLGRFLGSFVILMLISLGFHFGCILGFAVGPFLGLEEADRFGPFNLMAYLKPTVFYMWPNLLFTGAIFFALVAFTKRAFATYLACVVLFLAYLVTLTLTSDLDNKQLVDMLDPFALTTYFNHTQYFTPVEQNTLIPTLEGNLLYNRLIWMSVGLVAFFIVFFGFSFQRFMAVSQKKKKQLVDTAAAVVSKSLGQLPVSQKLFSGGSYFRQMLSLGRLEFRNIIRDPYFLAITLFGVLFLFFDGFFGNTTYGTPALPTTYYMLEAKEANFGLIVFILIVFYTGEVVHRDKSMKFNQIMDALPMPNWVMYGSKFLALVLMCLMLVTMPLISGIFNQVIQGYTDFQIPMYLTDLYILTFPGYILMAMIAFFIHIMVNKKFLGHAVAIGVWVAIFLAALITEYDFNMVFFGSTPSYRISDMNGFGHFLGPVSIFNGYWLSLGFVLLLVGLLFWNRGTESAFSVRRKVAKQNLNPTISLLSLGGIAAFVGLGSFIFYNTAVLNPYDSSKKTEKLQADYEEKFRKYISMYHPKIVDVFVESDIFPYERKVRAKGRFLMVNRTHKAIDSMYFNMPSKVTHAEISSWTFDGQPMTSLWEDEVFDIQMFKLPRTLMPGDTVVQEIDLTMQYKGFVNEGFNREVVYNGTFFNGGIFPSMGYETSRELSSTLLRKKYDLPIRDYALPHQRDLEGLHTLLFNDDADYVTFEAIVSTVPDQLAIAPGYLQREWEENGRKYYHYKMDSKMDMFYNFVSADYAVHEDTWTNPDGSKGNIEIYYHPTHTFNLDRFTDGVKRSMEYYNANFTPYQYKQMRILEFPRYASFAQSFPNTVPYSESFGWVGDFSDPEDTDYAFYVTAHEVAHQWWGHQITPSCTRGANQISESMAEYSALMVLKKEYGEEVMQKFLRYSLDRYLRGRANENKFEKTLLDNDDQSYVWYQKGSLVLCALQDYVSEDSLNQVFKTFLEDAGFREAPFANTIEWYEHIKNAVPDSIQYFVEDNFENIVIYENKTEEVKSKKISDTEYEVTLKVTSKKVYYDGEGNELKQGDQANLIEIGIFKEDGQDDRGMEEKQPLYLKKHWLKPGEHTLTFTVTEKPVKAGIDPYTKLIDRIPEDNLIDVEEE